MSDSRAPWDPDPRYQAGPEPVVRGDVEGGLSLSLVVLALTALILGVALGAWLARSVATPRAAAQQGAMTLTVSDGSVQLLGAPLSVTGGAPSLSGYATWYDVAPGNAAAGPDLRAWLGDWRGATVLVCHRGCVLVTLTDWCQCADRSGKQTLIDLSRTDFDVLGDPSTGVLAETISRAGAIGLPATDTEAP